MNGASLNVFETIVSFTLVVLLAALLRRTGIVRREDGPLFARLLTQAVLPAVIFTQLSTHPIAARQLWMVVAMIGAGVVSLGLAWGAGAVLKLDRPRTGALMICSAFGSSALVGYPLVQFAFPGNPEAMTDAVLISELGVGLPIFTLCPIVAMAFGTGAAGMGAWRKIVGGYLRSPIFIAVVLGLLIARFPIPTENPFVAPLFEALRMISGALTVLACLILGIQLDVRSARGILPLFAVSAVIQMVAQPLIAAALGSLFHIGALQRQVLVLVSLLPSAVLGPVFATRFSCEPEMASALVFLNITASVVVVPALFPFFAG